MSRLLLTLALALSCAAACLAEPLGPEAHLLELVNAERRFLDLPELAWDEDLAAIARHHARDMESTGIASHDSLRDGSSYPERLDRTGLSVLGFSENVALAGDLLRAHLWLMNSPPHRANLLDPDRTHVGLGVEESADGLAVFVVEDFVTLLPAFSEAEARRAVQGSLGELPRRLPSLLLREAEELSDEARRLAREMARTGVSQAPELPVVEHDVAYFYDTRDPTVLPETVAEIAPDALDYGLGVTRSLRPGEDAPHYWVVVIFRDIL
jgi:hypothetical protein